MSLRIWILTLSVCLGLLPAALAQRASSWRFFRASDGLRETKTVSVTVSPKGSIIATHNLDVDSYSHLDGYRIETGPTPGGQGKIYESRTGQLWSSSPSGLMVFREKAWLSFAIAPIKEAWNYAADHSVVLVPAEHDRVLFLVPGGLYEFSLQLQKATLLRSSAETEMGPFVTMFSSGSGELWVIGERGVARLESQVRGVKKETPWHIILPEQQFNGLTFRSATADARAGLLVLADGDLKRVLFRLNGDSWAPPIPLDADVEQVWTGANDTLWGRSRTEIFRLVNGQKQIVSREEIFVSQIYDVATDANDAFWMATSEGLVRYAPLIWQTPPDLEKLTAAAHAITETVDEEIYFLTSTHLMVNRQDSWSSHMLPDYVEKFFEPMNSAFTLADKTLLFDAHGKLIRFDPATSRFSPVASPPSTIHSKIIGLLREGVACLQVTTTDGEKKKSQLITFDGSQSAPLRETEGVTDFGDEIFFVFTARNGDIWIGGNAATAVFHDGKWQFFKVKDSDVMYCMIEIGEEKFWAGGRDKIWEFDGKKWAVVKTGFDRVNSLYRTRDGGIWIGSNSGLHRYYKGIWAWTGIEEGLRSAAVYDFFEDRLGRAWAGTAQGISRYFPGADSFPPQSFIYNMSTENNPAYENMVTLIFEGRDKWKQNSPDRLLYSYRMDEQEWSTFSSETKTRFQDLPAGKHHFQVRAFDRNWNMEIKHPVYEFAITLPWYQETRLVLISIVGGTVALFFAGLAFNRHRKLVKSYAEVEKIVALRTEQLEQANRQLLHSQKMNALGALAAGIAHDFNNILSIIKGSAQIIESNITDGEKIRTRVNRIKLVVDQGAAIVKAMLGFSRTPEGKTQPCQINEVVEETMHMLGDRFQHEVEVVFEPSENLPPAIGSRDQIQQILLNLIFNASEASDNRGKITLRTVVSDTIPPRPVLSPAPAQKFILIEVEDEGCGISPEILPRIFEPFFTTKAFSSRRGTGLGLSMVYELARQLGYGLKVESQVGKGSIFCIIVPLKSSIVTAGA